MDLANEIWIPKVYFSNSLTETQLEIDGFASIEILRQGASTVSGENELHANEIFSGEANPLLLKRIFNIEFNCEFNLKNYPLDFQECFINVRNSSLIIASSIRENKNKATWQFDKLKISYSYQSFANLANIWEN